MKVKIQHKFRNFKNKKDIQFLILGTFNPETPGNNAKFFYGREKNYLWNLLPKSFDYDELKRCSLKDKLLFTNKFKIGFADIIREVAVDSGNETNYADSYIDSRVTRWLDFELFVNRHQKIKKVFLTRKTFTDIPNMRDQIEKIKNICEARKIGFYTLPTPSRFESS